MRGEDLVGRAATPDPPGEDVGHYSDSHAGAKYALNDSRPALYLGHNFSPLVAEDVFLRSLILPHQLIGSDAPVFLFLHRIAADPDSLDYGKSHVVIRHEEHLALRKAIDKAAKRYLDRCDREEADRIRELDRVERRIAECGAERAARREVGVDLAMAAARPADPGIAGPIRGGSARLLRPDPRGQ